jgi:hypothetical protein
VRRSSSLSFRSGRISSASSSIVVPFGSQLGAVQHDVAEDERAVRRDFEGRFLEARQLVCPHSARELVSGAVDVRVRHALRDCSRLAVRRPNCGALVALGDLSRAPDVPADRDQDRRWPMTLDVRVERPPQLGGLVLVLGHLGVDQHERPLRDQRVR